MQTYNDDQLRTFLRVQRKREKENRASSKCEHKIEEKENSKEKEEEKKRREEESRKREIERKKKEIETIKAQETKKLVESIKDKIKGLLQQHREEKPTLARDTNRSRGQDFRRTMDRVREEVSVAIQSWSNTAQRVTSL